MARQHDIARAHEDTVCRALGASPTNNSGAGTIRADARVKGDIRIECKATDKASYSVSLKTWGALQSIAAMGREEPVLAVRIQNTDLVVIDLDYFERLRDGQR